MVKLLKRSSLSLHFEKHKGATGGLQKHNEREPGQRHSNKNIVSEKTKDNIFLKEKNALTYGERIKRRLDEGYKKEKAIRKDAVKMIEVTVQFGGDITNEPEEVQVEALKEAYEELKEMYGEENIISAVIHVDETTPHLHMDFVPLTKQGNLSAKEVIGDKKKMKKTQKDFLTKMQERCAFAKFERLEPDKAQFNGLDQKIFEKMTEAVNERENALYDREDDIEDKEIELEDKEEELNKQIKAFEQEKRNIGEFVEQMKQYSALVEKQAEMNENKGKALKERETLLNRRETGLNERETSLNEIEASVRVADQEAKRLLEEANKRVEVAEATENRVKRLLESLDKKSKELVRNIKETVGKWTARVARDRRESLHEYFQERTEELTEDLEEHQREDEFVMLAYEDVAGYDNDMSNAFEL